MADAEMKQSEQPTKPKERIAVVCINGGVHHYPIVSEGSHGFTCRVSKESSSPATEWFPFDSQNCRCHELV